jgi:hypothetical protein
VKIAELGTGGITIPSRGATEKIIMNKDRCKAEEYEYEGRKGYRLTVEGFDVLLWFPLGSSVNLEETEFGVILQSHEPLIVLDAKPKELTT